MSARLTVLTALLASFMLAPAGARASDTALPRHGVLGVVTAVGTGPTTIATIVPGSVAAAAGLRKGDEVLSVDGVPVADYRAFLAAIRRPAGRAARLGIERAGIASTVTVMLKAPPDESDPRVDTLYGAVPFEGTLRRSLLTVPHGSRARHPALIVVGGIGCYSIDVAANASDPYLNLARDLGRKGIVVMRLEKSGLGDSQGPPCSTVDFRTESASYDAALHALAANPAVDPSKIYLFGHSIGSIIVPRMANAHRVAGVIVAEGVARDWYEYELSNAREQLPLAGLKPAEVDAEMLQTEICKYRVLIGKETVEQVVHERPDCAPDIQYPAPSAYVQQVADLNIAEPWAKLDVPALFVYGSADFVTTEDDHRLLSAIVNAHHAGSATLKIIDGMDHYLTPAAGRQASFDRAIKGQRGPYDPRFSEVVIGWLCARETCF